ncbi:catechol 2,3-dioxygenase-like lactoylglutathione lyase family enzyme [Thermocatellispora tengchongensis]|uniref:Catechol 2,3-dioxygenase-like lactoylglutathione lyase family enzyme n=1 Tax=Thermocatellispora tengchongensis TaxID=1073253 RepID=A0A840PBN5_9ACTN|nr:VOC family protein [Thermocatellispora tengchongensis]MBB5136662.1 catechol 2,3-dioxygenase-like lactoylglutathione lyase family enzyme [Thermocatellispora tengchongensis]
MFTAVGRTVLLVKDQDEALAFYRDVLGFTVLHDQVADGYRFLHIGLPGRTDGGLWLMPASGEDLARVGAQTGGQPLLVLYTGDLAAVRERLAEAGVEMWAEQRDAGGASLHFRDLYGNVIIAAQLDPAGSDPRG